MKIFLFLLISIVIMGCTDETVDNDNLTSEDCKTNYIKNAGFCILDCSITNGVKTNDDNSTCECEPGYDYIKDTHLCEANEDVVHCSNDNDCPDPVLDEFNQESGFYVCGIFTRVCQLVPSTAPSCGAIDKDNYGKCPKGDYPLSVEACDKDTLYCTSEIEHRACHEFVMQLETIDKYGDNLNNPENPICGNDFICNPELNRCERRVADIDCHVWQHCPELDVCDERVSKCLSYEDREPCKLNAKLIKPIKSIASEGQGFCGEVETECEEHFQYHYEGGETYYKPEEDHYFLILTAEKYGKDCNIRDISIPSDRDIDDNHFITDYIHDRVKTKIRSNYIAVEDNLDLVYKEGTTSIIEVKRTGEVFSFPDITSTTLTISTIDNHDNWDTVIIENGEEGEEYNWEHGSLSIPIEWINNYPNPW